MAKYVSVEKKAIVLNDCVDQNNSDQDVEKIHKQ